MPPLDLSGFVSPAQTFEGFTKAADILSAQQDKADKLQKQKESQQLATSKFLTDYLDPKDHLTGTNYDPQVVAGYGSILQQAQGLAAKGVSNSDILMAIGPSVNKLSQYSTTAKLIQDRIKNYTEQFKNIPGYNVPGLADTAAKMAFQNYDEKSKSFGDMKPIKDVDPNINWVEKAMEEHPELVSNEEGLIKSLSTTKQDDLKPRGETMYAGRKIQTGFNAKLYPFQELTSEKDQYGNPKGVQTRFEIAHDGGKPIQDEQGNQMKVAPDDVYNYYINKSGIKPFLDAQTKKVAEQLGEAVPAHHTEHYKLLQKHILYNWLEDNAPKSFSPIDKQSETSQAIKIDIAQHPDQLRGIAEFNAAQRGTGDYAAYNPKAGKAIKTNAVDAIGKVFNNDPVFLQGEHKEIGGRNVIDVTDFMPGGGLKSGRGADEVYKGIYYDPVKRSLLVTQQPRVKDDKGQKPTDLEEIPESKAGLFMTRIAAANGVDPDKVSDILSKHGYKGAKFTNPSQPGTVPTDLAKEHNDKIDFALNENKYDSPIFKGLKTADGTIQKVDERTYTSWLPGRDKYAVDVKTSDGKTKTVTFKTKDELTKYIKKGQPEAPKAVLD